MRQRRIELGKFRFLSTLSLRRATPHFKSSWQRCCNFYPRSPCGERLAGYRRALAHCNISIHALLAESDILKSMSVMVISISIHALLAESDKVVIPGPPIMIPISIHALLAESDWGPRWIKCHLPRFLSTLSLRRATAGFRQALVLCTISIHALLAESDYNIPPDSVLIIDISIHALLAESDSKRYKNYGMPLISIHALLAESDKLWDAPDMPTQEISIHALLAESDRGKFHDPGKILFLSTLSLRRATRLQSRTYQAKDDFYPRSACRTQFATHRFLSTLSLRRATFTVYIVLL